jgi:non-specific serine/threonine protein kinase/serine/threonine-protein kinase
VYDPTTDRPSDAATTGSAPTWPAEPDAAAVAAGRSIGPYTLLEKIGQGGMGVVYRAQQEHPIRRVVALKLLRLGEDSEIATRFESERQALALLDHPAIARIFDAGTSPTGQPYFVMEYVAGEPITSFCDRHRLSIEQRLRLFMEVCDAIQHAHYRGIVHRDLKPSNVLVAMREGDAPAPAAKVIDFGIAKVIAPGLRLAQQTLQTQYGTLIGTPLYMSPEQAAGSADIDTRTDVYALGVMLYELLAGLVPFDPATLTGQTTAESILRQIREVEPPRPSTRIRQLELEQRSRIASARQIDDMQLEHQLRRELEWIPLKAIRKERERRYDTPLQIAADIRNYLEGLPLLAGPESRAYRLKKFLVRNRRSVAASAILIAGLIAAVTIYIHDMRAEQRKTREALDTARAVLTFQRQMFDAADPIERGDKVTVLQAMQTAMQKIDGGQFRDRPQVEMAIRDMLSMTFFGLARFDLALPNAQRAVELARATGPPGEPQLADYLNKLGRIYQQLARPREAEPLFRESLDIRRRVLQKDDPAISECVNNLAGLYVMQGKYSDAEPLFRELLERERTLHPKGEPVVALRLGNLALTLQHQGKLADAEALFREAVEVNRRVLEADHPQLAESLNNLSVLLRKRGQLDEAETLGREAVAICRKSLPDAHSQTAQTLSSLAMLLKDRGKLDEAEPLAREALQMYGKVLPPGHPATAIAMSNVGVVLQAREKFDEAESYFRKALETGRAALGDKHGTTQSIAVRLADLLDSRRRADEAAALRREFDLPATAPVTK